MSHTEVGRGKMLASGSLRRLMVMMLALGGVGGMGSGPALDTIFLCLKTPPTSTNTIYYHDSRCGDQSGWLNE